MRWIGDEDKAREYAMEMTEKDCYDAYQALEYEVNTLHTANGQDAVCYLWIRSRHQLGRTPGTEIDPEKPYPWSGPQQKDPGIPQTGVWYQERCELRP